MATEKGTLYGVLKKVLTANLLLYLCSAPIFYFLISFDLTGTKLPYAYMAARILRFLLVIAVGYGIRKRNQEVFARCALQRVKLMHVIFGCIIVGVWLHFSSVAPTLYITVSNMIGVYHSGTVPLFLAVLWEQLFAGDLFWSILLCLGIVFFTWRSFAKRECV